MHEIHLLKDILDDVLRTAGEANAKKVTKIYIRMGEFTEINPEILKRFFEEESRGTIVEGAQISIEKSDTRELRLLSFDCE